MSVLTEFVAVVEGNPGDAKVNGWKVPVVRSRKKGGLGGITMIEGAEYRRWKQRAALVFRAAAAGRSFGPGPVSVAIVAYWPRKHRQGPAVGLVLGDVDAVAKAVLDALESAGVLADDAQATRLGCAKAYDKRRPRIEVKVVRA